ncbi:MAG: HD domain-containing protein [Candidatus Heimdallarchaeota archaeon]|nr:HD domain-containing protein [Candidatus Heimdallarchaeota archaeon]
MQINNHDSILFAMNGLSEGRILAQYLPQIREYAKKYYSPTDSLHGLAHIQRVLINAHRIHALEGGNWEIIETIIWLHDIGRSSKDQGKNHAHLSWELAESFLTQFLLPEQLCQEIRHGIIAHSFSNGEEAHSLEAQIVSDADKLDALGAIGIFRACAYQALHHQGIQQVLTHCDDKLYRLEHMMYLPSGKSLAKKRTLRIRQFHKDTLEELGDSIL